MECEPPAVLLVVAALAAQPPGRFLAESLGAADGLSTAMVYGVALDAEGRVHVATERGVSRFDGTRFEDVVLDGVTSAGGCAAIANLSGTLWAQCTDALYRQEGERLVRVAEVPEPDVRAGLAVGPDGAVWAAGAAGVHTIRDGGVAALPAPAGGWHPRAVHADGDGVWVGAAEGLFRVVGGGAPVRVDPHPVRAFLADPGGLLVGREDGLFRADGTPVPLARPCYVTGLARGPAARLGVGCGDGAQLQAPDGAWEAFGPNEGLPGTVVRGVAVGGDGTVWLAVWKRGLVRLGEAGVRLWSGDDLRIEPVADLLAEDGELLVAGWQGAWSLDATLVPTRLPHPTPADPDYVSLQRDGAGQLVVGTVTDTWTLEPPGWRKTRPEPPLWDFGRDAAGVVWGSDHDRVWTASGERQWSLPADVEDPVFSRTRDGALVVVGRRRVWRLGADALVDDGPAPAGCEGAPLHELPDARWLACASGIFVDGGAGWRAWAGLVPGEVPRSSADGPDGLWVSTSAGRLLRVGANAAVLDQATGLPRVSFLSTRGLARFGEWLVAATAEGILWVRPEELGRPREAPTVHLVSLEARGVPVDAAALGPDDTFLRVRLGLSGAPDPARTRYRFRLDDGEWSSPVADPTLQLPGLTAGPHRLEAAASTAGSGWSVVPATLSFTIPERWWERTDVRAGAALAVVAGLALLWNERHRRVVAALAHAHELEKVRQTFGRFVTPEVAEAALAGRLSTRGEARVVTVLFADLRGFTPLTASMEPRALVDLLNAWLTAMVEAIEAEGGVVNKFVGDAVVAIFNAPHEQPDHAERAVRAAVRMAAATHRVGVRHGRPLRAGIGVNSGSVIAGPVGAASRMEYTVIGEVVNVAARVEGLTRRLDVDVLVADATARRLGAHDLVDRGEHGLRGVAAPVRVWAPAEPPGA